MVKAEHCPVLHCENALLSEGVDVGAMCSLLKCECAHIALE